MFPYFLLLFSAHKGNTESVLWGVRVFEKETEVSFPSFFDSVLCCLSGDMAG